MRPSSVLLSLALLLFAFPKLAGAATLEVGPNKPYAKPCDAVAAARPNDVIEIQPGTYTDSCSLNKAGLTLRGAGGRPVIDLSGTDHPYGYKGIYVIDADGVTLENLELKGANISCGNGANGAGIRNQSTNLTVRRCYIHDNQNGILGGGGTTTIEYSEFARNGTGPGCTCGGCTHNLYTGQSGGKLVFRYNYTHSITTDGHLLKTRTDETWLLYNRFTGEAGHDSYEIDIPNGGLSVVVGNLVEKGPNPGNYVFFNWGEEGVTKADKRVFLANNTFVNDTTKGTFVQIAGGGMLTAHNNLFVGPGTVSNTGALPADNVSGVDPLFVNRAQFDYHLQPGSPVLNKGVDPGLADMFNLTPTMQYVHPAAVEPRPADGKLDVGAYEYGVVMPPADMAGMPGAPDLAASPDLIAAAPRDLAGTDAAGADAASAMPPGGCACAVSGRARSPASILAAVVAFTLVAFARRRRRRSPIIALLVFLPVMNAAAEEPSNVARLVAADLDAGRFAAVVARFDDTMRGALPEDKLRATWNGLLGQTGKFTVVKAARSEQMAGHRLDYATCAFEKAALDLKVALDDKGRIAGLFFVPAQAEGAAAWQPASWADPGSFTEREITIGAGDEALPGTLTIPKAKGPHPAIVLIHGSGPNDRDETIGPNKVFKDLAFGLAARGVVVLRYEKATRVHPERFTKMKAMTVKEEVVADAKAAHEALVREAKNKTLDIDPLRIYLAGHSLGGYLLPRIARTTGMLQGIVILAGSTRPLPLIAREQLEYLGAPAEMRAKLDAAIARLAAPDVKPDEKIDFLGASIPAGYFLDLRDYDPAAVAEKLGVRLLALQGGRDYQVRADKDFPPWQAVAAKNPRSSAKLLPRLNHLLIDVPGAKEGPGRPEEYATAGHVDLAVIEEIARFVGGR